MPRLAGRIGLVKPSATIAVKQEADRLRALGVDVIDFGPGEPDFPAPANVKRAAHRAIDEDLSHYLPTQGLPALRRAVAAHYASTYGTDYDASEVIVSCGGKNALFEAALALVEPGDEVIIPSPYWVSFPEQVLLAGGVPVILPASESDGFIPRASQAARLAGPDTKAIILCSPSNPTGAVIPAEEIEAFADLVMEKDLYLVFDECYEKFLYDGRRHASPARHAGRLRDRLILVSTLSKSYAMTGYRIGYAVSCRPIVAALAAVQGHDCTHPTAIAQAAAVEALEGPQDDLRRMIEEYRLRRDLMVEGLRSIPGVTCATPPGSFYAFPGVTGLCQRLGSPDSASLAGRLLAGARIATVPGEAFGAPGFLRFSYALSQERIREGIERLRSCAAGR
ncbi:MAG TPA: pyridoxal phosphate-dependent aminotransferase [Candidatus Polarisedimenticolia bacterium]|nr:pyridoxal phosphate-dependent aminotransferase [Candidatus Polarisedimenticolia bacterium]